MNLKLAIRTLLKNPFITIVSVVSLALGIGANAAIFSMFHQILLRNLPVPEPDRLVNISSPGPQDGSMSCGDPGSCDSVFSYPMFRDLERQQSAFTGVAAHVFFSGNFAHEGRTEHGSGAAVSGSYFPVLGVKPALGRLFSAVEDAKLDEPHAVVLGHDYWRRRFAEDPNILNQVMIVNGQPMTIVGVAAKDFRGTTVGSAPDVFIPITMMRYAWPGFDGFANRQHYWAYLFARLKPGVSAEQAVSSVNGFYRSIITDVEAPLQHMTETTLAKFKSRQIRLAAGGRGQSQVHEEAKAPLYLMLGATGFVLLIACSNVANLLLARAASRAGEMAVRLSIGASRRQLILQLLSESCLLAALGGVFGLLTARWTLTLLAASFPEEVKLTFEIGTPVILFTAAVTLVTGILFGLAPALQSTRPDLVSALKGQAGQPGGSRFTKALRTILATTQIGLCMTLLILAGLFTKSLFNVSRAQLGFNPDHVATFRVAPALNGYSAEQAITLYGRIEEELKAIPGVAGVTGSTVPLLSGNNWGSTVKVQGFEPAPDADISTNYTNIAPDYFRTLGIALIQGREFTLADVQSAPNVVIVNERFAKKFNLGRDAVGKRINTQNKPTLDTEIVGLVQDSKYSEIVAEQPPVFFRPYRQAGGRASMSFYVRSSVDSSEVLKAIPRIMSRLDPNLPVQDLRKMIDQVRENVWDDRIMTILSGSFAIVATILASVGLYGVLAYTVSQQTREFGVRMALGATPNRVRGMVLRRVALMTGIGGGLGLATALAAGALAESMLFQLNGHDPLVVTSSVLILVLIAFGAGFIPAQRASRIDPIRALRYE